MHSKEQVLLYAGPKSPKVARFRATKSKTLQMRNKKSVSPLRTHRWSECRDSNPRPLGPEPSAIPSFATPRHVIMPYYYKKEACCCQVFLFRKACIVRNGILTLPGAYTAPDFPERGEKLGGLRLHYGCGRISGEPVAALQHRERKKCKQKGQLQQSRTAALGQTSGVCGNLSGYGGDQGQYAGAV